MSARVIRPAAFERTQVMLDLGKVPPPHPYAGKWVVTLQIAPLENIEDAKAIEQSLRMILSQRFGLTFVQEDVPQ